MAGLAQQSKLDISIYGIKSESEGYNNYSGNPAVKFDKTLTHSAAHTKPFLSHSLGKREASTVCTRWVLHRRQRPVAEDRVPFALGVRIGQRSFSALRWDAKPLQQSAPRHNNQVSILSSEVALMNCSAFRLFLAL
ncbi:hypothetical protein JHK86_012639 [Glycine max]|nr:hypothetical protein JHK86_012639 [Glycine max]